MVVIGSFPVVIVETRGAVETGVWFPSGVFVADAEFVGAGPGIAGDGGGSEPSPPLTLVLLPEPTELQ